MFSIPTFVGIALSFALLSLLGIRGRHIVILVEYHEGGCLVEMFTVGGGSPRCFHFAGRAAASAFVISAPLRSHTLRVLPSSIRASFG